MKKPGLFTLKNKGFTLLELVMALALASLLMLVLFQVFFAGVRLMEDSTDRERDLTFVLDAIEKEIREAEELVNIRGVAGYRPRNAGFLLRGPSLDGGLTKKREVYFYCRWGAIYRYASREDSWGGHNVIYDELPVDLSQSFYDEANQKLSLVLTCGDQTWTRVYDLSLKWGGRP